MLIVTIVAARWVIRRFEVSQTLPATNFGRIGCIGTVVTGLRSPGVLWLRGLPLREYLASFANAPGIISLVMLLLFGSDADSRHVNMCRVRAISTEKNPEPEARARARSR
jgi:hypothetical protein